jgi:hypothetical protein
MLNHEKINKMDIMRKSCGCVAPCACIIPDEKKMKSNGVNVSGMPGFRIKAPEYKGNAALNAQK